MNNLVSIITPSYNSEEFITNTILSVKAQTYENWEMIIVDDVSSDNSLKIINSFIKNDKRIKLYELSENSGAGIARNKAIQLSKGDFIAFLDSDDLWIPNKLELQINFMIDNNYNFTHTYYNIIVCTCGYSRNLCDSSTYHDTGPSTSIINNIISSIWNISKSDINYSIVYSTCSWVHSCCR